MSPRQSRFTPEKTRAWFYAFLPASVMVGTGYMLVTNKHITPETVALLIGFLTAGSVRAIVKPHDYDPKKKLKEKIDKIEEVVFDEDKGEDDAEKGGD